MNIDDLFADDLKALDTVMAQFGGDRGRQSHSLSGGLPSAEPAVGVAGTGMVGRQGRRGELLPSLAPSVSERQPVPVDPGRGRGATTKAMTLSKDEPLPWELGDDVREVSEVARRHVSEDSLGAFHSSPLSAVKRDVAAPALGGAEDDDPLAFLEGPTAGRAPTAATVIASPPLLEAECSETVRRAEQRELLASLDAVEMELEQLQESLGTLQIKTESELTELEATVIEKQTELACCEDSFATERRAYDTYHQRRMQVFHDNTSELLEREREEASASANQMLEAELCAIKEEVQDVHSRIDQLLEQRELLQQCHRFDEKGILLSLRMEDEKNILAGAGDEDGGSIRRKMDTALCILREHHNKQLNSIASDVLRFLHQETINVAREVRKRHEVAYVQDAVRRKEALGEFMHDLLLRYRDFFHHRAEQKTRNRAVVREGLQKATAQLRLHATQRLETRMQDVAAKVEEAARRFQQLVADSVDCAHRKAAALREGDESLEKREREDLLHRFNVEQTVLKKLQQSEVEMLQEQLERLKRLGDDGGGALHQIPKEIQAMCVTRAESCTGAVRAMESEVQQLLRQQRARNMALSVEAESMHVYLSDEELALRMATQERNAVFASLLEEVQKRQGELFAARYSCGDLREKITSMLQDEVQYVRQKRAEQESHLASVELLRMAWEREQREILRWGHDVLLQQDIPCSSRTHLPAATSMVNAVCLVSERNQTLLAGREKLRMQHSQLHHVIQKELEELAVGWRAVEARWVQLFEQLLALMAQQETLVARQLSGEVEMAKIETAKELLQQNTTLLRRRHEELQAETNRLKEELQKTLEQKAEHVVLQQKLAKEQIALAQRQYRLALEHTRVESSTVADAASRTPTSQLQHTALSPLDNGATLRFTADKL